MDEFDEVAESRRFGPPDNLFDVSIAIPKGDPWRVAKIRGISAFVTQFPGTTRNYYPLECAIEVLDKNSREEIMADAHSLGVKGMDAVEALVRGAEAGFITKDGTAGLTLEQIKEKVDRGETAPSEVIKPVEEVVLSREQVKFMEVAVCAKLLEILEEGERTTEGEIEKLQAAARDPEVIREVVAVLRRALG